MNSYHIPFTRWRQQSTLMRMVLGWLYAGQAQALIGGSVTCSVPAPQNGYTVEPNTDMSIAFNGNCRAIRVFPYGAALNHELYLTSGRGIYLRLYEPVYNIHPDPKPLGNPLEGCLSPYCGYVAPGGNFSFTVYGVGRTPCAPRPFELRLRLGYTAILYNDYAKWVSETNFRVTVRDTACTLSLPSSVDLSLGSITSANLSNQSQSTSVQLNCPSAKSSPVVLNSPQFMQLRAGSNALNLTFKPQLASQQAPSGAFQSQYTLVNYL